MKGHPYCLWEAITPKPCPSLELGKALENELPLEGTSVLSYIVGQREPGSQASVVVFSVLPHRKGRDFFNLAFLKL